MKSNISKTAFTLTELIIALMLVSVIVLGIFAISNVLSNNSQDYGQRYSVRSQTQTTLDRILNDASLAVGSTAIVGNQSVPDQGIVTWTTGSNQNLCIHQGPDTAGIWACYEWDNTSLPVPDAAYKQICYCTVAYNLTTAADSERGAESANCCGVPNSFVGTAFNTTWSFTDIPFTANINGEMNGQSFFSVSIQNCLNDLIPSCAANSDPVNNPQVTISGSVTPLQAGMLQN